MELFAVDLMHNNIINHKEMELLSELSDSDQEDDDYYEIMLGAPSPKQAQCELPAPRKAELQFLRLAPEDDEKVPELKLNIRRDPNIYLSQFGATNKKQVVEVEADDDPRRGTQAPNEENFQFDMTDEDFGEGAIDSKINTYIKLKKLNSQVLGGKPVVP